MLAQHRLWTLNALFYAVLCVFTLAGFMVDERTIAEVSVWQKPFKFSLSITVYFATLAWLAPLLSQAFWSGPVGRGITWAAISMAALEVGYIYLMAGLGEASHFNLSTPLTAVMYSLMGVGAMTMVGVCLVQGLAIGWSHRQRLHEPFLLAVVFGLVLTFVLGGGFGSYLGSQMTHWVGAPATDAGGLPLFNWSRDGGDLRVAHFFGMHAMQVLPAVGWLLTGRAGGAALVLLATFAYAALTTITFAQALNGLPFVS